MKKKLLLFPLAFLFAFPSCGCAADTAKAAGLPASFYCASAKLIAEGYVSLIKEKYADKEKDQNYYEARLKYQIAAAKFAGVRSTFELEMIGGSRIPNINNAQYQSMVMDALRAFDEFDAISQKIVFSSPDQFNGHSMAELNFASVITDIFSFVTRFQEIWVRHDQIRESRLKKLEEWVENYFKWTNWEELGKPASGDNALA